MLEKIVLEFMKLFLSANKERKMMDFVSYVGPTIIFNIFSSQVC